MFRRLSVAAGQQRLQQSKAPLYASTLHPHYLLALFPEDDTACIGDHKADILCLPLLLCFRLLTNPCRSFNENTYIETFPWEESYCPS